MHISVLKNEITETFLYLNDIQMPVFVDGTFGLGGHSLAITSKLDSKNFKIIGIDKDQNALNFAKSKIPSSLNEKILLVNDDYKNIKEILNSLGIKKVDGILLDLGISSLQIDSESRGFSFKNKTAPLDMRMDTDQKKDAAYILNNYRKEDLAKILEEYGEERFASKIAHNIAKFRTNKHFEVVGDLLEIIDQSIPEKFKYGKIHPATRTFQALRIEVNQELIGLEKALKQMIDALNVGCKIAVISFHSLEDRIVKNTFKELSAGCICPKEVPICQCHNEPTLRVLTNKPIIPNEEEIKDNPRSRSAKLRIAEKIR